MTALSVVHPLGSPPDHPASDRPRHHAGRDRVRADLELGTPDHRAVAVRLADRRRPEPQQDVRRRLAHRDARRSPRVLPTRRRSLHPGVVRIDRRAQGRLDRRTPGLGAGDRDDPGDRRRSDARELHPGRARATVADRRDAGGVRHRAVRGRPGRVVAAASRGSGRSRRSPARHRAGPGSAAGRLALGRDDDGRPAAHVRPGDRGPVLVPALAAGDRGRRDLRGSGPRG